MAVLRSSSKRSRDSSSSSCNSKTDVSDASLDDPKRLRSRDVPVRALSKDRQSTSKDRQDYVRPYATDALSFYNEAIGNKYKLVEPGCISNVLLPTCLLHHIDFTAKKSANAPEEMFFC
ncbi:hypothetical protein MKW92_035779 [Papaver armeniacum]|nr:hypothetical protein MKW92_035779 [Papaver armeniacum]